MVVESRFKRKLQNGLTVESEDEMSEGYKQSLKKMLQMAGDTELMSAAAYYEQSLNAPTLNARTACIGILQDELGHGHLSYRLLEDLNEDRESLVHDREPHEFQNTYGFDQYIENFAELVTGQALWDRAGMVLLSDVHENTSYGPWMRALTKVSKEEQFHLQHGEVWMRRLAGQNNGTKYKLQAAVDWMFPTAVEWFGLPDEKKSHDEQLEYCLKGKTNDELRQAWLSETVPLCESLVLDVPAYYSEEDEKYVLEYDFPIAFDEGTKAWRFEESISWSDVIERWRSRGPANEQHVNLIQSESIQVGI